MQGGVRWKAIEGDILGKPAVIASILANGVDSIYKVVHVCGVWTFDLVQRGPLEAIPPTLRLEKALFTGGVGGGGCLSGLELVVGKVDIIRQKSRLLDRISYDLACLCRG